MGQFGLTNASIVRERITEDNVREEKPGPSPDHSFTAAQLVHQERQDGCFLRRTVSLEGLSPEAERQSGQLCPPTVSLHEYLQDLRHIVSVDVHISQVFPQNGFVLQERMSVRM